MNADPALISVVIIFLDAAPFLPEAIASVQAQTDPNWEILLVDDGSTDGSTEIARAQAQAHPDRIRYLEHAGHANRGMSASRNLGVRQSRGTLIAFLDADDVWLPEKLARQRALLEQHPEADLVCGPTLWWWSWTGDTARPDRPRELGLAATEGLHPPGRLLTALLREQARTPATCSILMRRELFERVGGFEEQFRGMFEDQAFFAKVYLHGTTLVTATILDHYRQHPASHCHESMRDGSYQASQHRFLRWLEAYLGTQEVADPALQQALRAAFWPFEHPGLHRIQTLLSAIRQKGLWATWQQFEPPLHQWLVSRLRRGWPPARSVTDA